MRAAEIEEQIVANPWRAIGIALVAGGILGMAHRRGGLIGGAIAALMIRGAKHFAFGELSEQAKTWLNQGPGATERGASNMRATESFFRH